ncbi:MAG TPA: HupE/UreJ family protein [Fibrobacteria bacterium]|nr:HupE/UreJ family protein [Fibrobacteria bacterium]
MKKAVAPVLFLSALACAHPGHGAHGLVAGLVHPWTGIDHLAAMAAVGVWASLLEGRMRWVPPAVFLSAMTIGFALGWTGFVVPGTETGIQLGLAMLGLALAFRWVPGLPVVAVATGLCAFVHGQAHGAEVPASASGAAFAAGFLASTAVLHLCGMGIGVRIRESKVALRMAGAGLVALAGVLAIL